MHNNTVSCILLACLCEVKRLLDVCITNSEYIILYITIKSLSASHWKDAVEYARFVRVKWLPNEEPSVMYLVYYIIGIQHTMLPASHAEIPNGKVLSRHVIPVTASKCHMGLV